MENFAVSAWFYREMGAVSLFEAWFLYTNILFILILYSAPVIFLQDVKFNEYFVENFAISAWFYSENGGSKFVRSVVLIYQHAFHFNIILGITSYLIRLSYVCRYF